MQEEEDEDSRLDIKEDLKEISEEINLHNDRELSSRCKSISNAPTP